MKRNLKIKKVLGFTLALGMSMAVMTGCSSETSTEDSANDTSESESASTDEAATNDTTDGIDYPTQPIQVIVPAGAGGDTDQNARMFAKFMEEELGQPLVIVNMGGGGGIIGMDSVRSSNPDGYTSLFFHVENMIPKITGLADYDYHDFEIAGIGLVDNTTVIATHKDSPYTTMEELQAYALDNPGEVEFGMQVGGYSHILGLALEDELGVEFNHVDIGGNSAKTTALVARQTDVINTQYGLTKDYFDTGEFIALGLTSPERNQLIPDVLTTTEQGFPLDFNKFFYFAFPEGTPAEVVDKFSTALENVTNNSDFIAEAESKFLTPVFMDSETSIAYMDEVFEGLMEYQSLLD